MWIGVGMGTKEQWDKGVDFDTAKSELAAKILDARSRCGVVVGEDAYGKPFEDKLPYTELGIYSAALIQLKDGTRASEAVDAMVQFIKTGNRKPKYRVRKKSVECALVRTLGIKPMTTYSGSRHRGLSRL